jgi:hypothetical protein
VYLETGVKPGSEVDYTIDLFTGVGSAILVHSDREQLKRDVELCRQLEKDGKLFEFESPKALFKSPSMSTIGSTTVAAANRPDLE